MIPQILFQLCLCLAVASGKTLLALITFLLDILLLINVLRSSDTMIPQILIQLGLCLAAASGMSLLALITFLLGILLLIIILRSSAQ